MGCCYKYSIVALLLLSLVTICRSQAGLSITAPTLTSVTPLNSTAITITWTFASSNSDQSNLIRIYIVIYEFYYTYNAIYASSNYTFTTANKTITNMTMNFELVNAYYYVCFSSNSTITNISQFLFVSNTCRMIKTCTRSGTTCPGPPVVSVSATSISATTIIITFVWPNELPYTVTSYTAQLTTNGQTGTALSTTQNTTYTFTSNQFTSLQANTAYTVNTSVTYTLLNSFTSTNTSIFTVTTSRSLRLYHAGNFFLVFFAFSVLFFSHLFYFFGEICL